ncbi:MAG: DUF4411 family protein [Bacteroidetes bacterium]|nr:DUF4411 family protein [Bacteroidota bacterium]
MQKYSIDTSAILDAWVRYYPHDTFPSFWNRFKTLHQQKTINNEICLTNLENTKTKGISFIKGATI